MLSGFHVKRWYLFLVYQGIGLSATVWVLRKKEMGSVFRFYTFSYIHDNLPAIWVGSYCVCFYLTQIPSLFLKKKKKKRVFHLGHFFYLIYPLFIFSFPAFNHWLNAIMVSLSSSCIWKYTSKLGICWSTHDYNSFMFLILNRLRKF